MLNYSHFLDRPIFAEIGKAADRLGLECYVVGGYVRDRLIDCPTKMDLDFVTVGSGISLAKEVRKGFDKKPKLTVFKSFGTAHMNYKGVDLEFVGARNESYKRNSRNPIIEDGTLEDDQNRRDFTINAMAICLNEERWGELVDPFNGVADLEKKLIRTPLSPDKTFDDDPLRMMRAVRFAAQLDYLIDPGTLMSIREHACRLEIIAPERIGLELNKIMAVDKPSYGLGLLFTSGLLEEIMPEICALQGVEEVEGQLHKDNFYHTLEVLDNLARTSENLWLRWAALLHDIGKPRTKKFIKQTGWTFRGHEFVGSKMIPKIFKRLRLPTDARMKYVQKMVMMSSRPASLVDDTVTDSAVRRLLFDAGDDVEDLMLLCEADLTTKNENKKRRYLNNFKEVRLKFKEVEERDHIRNFQPPVSGQEIMEHFGIGPSRVIGEIKEVLKEAILEGRIPNEKQAALDLMEEVAQKLGLTK
ncbi:MAG TPA: tRNA nucleotidyltransferase [Cryomorphaceae bacterium]|nr:tRNA nucleotidyltransferase [Cryomorphaceae bacterium]|tara:strand:+ start:1337 stop:2752 length:1416 start_codon:yes stop_codon:yes gene_type:complete